MYLIQHGIVKGDQNIGNFRECFKIISVEYSGGRPTSQARVGKSSFRNDGTPSFSPIRIKKLCCKATQALQESCNFGAPVDSCKIYFIDSNNSEYMEIALTNAQFSNYQFQAHGGIPRESFDITYTAITTRHIPRTEKGLPSSYPASTSFNLTKGTR